MNPRNLYKRYLPQRQHFHDNQRFKCLSSWLHEAKLWHLTRRSAASAVAAGFFIAFIPAPGQMLIAALVAILAKINLPLTVMSVWLSNPLTMAPMFVMAYKIGAVLLGLPANNLHFELSFHWISETLIHIWEPLFLGCFVLGVFFAAIGNITVRLLWRIALIRKWKRRGKDKDE